MSNRNYDKLVVAAEQNTKERDYWLDTLSGNPVKSTFAYDFPRRRDPRHAMDSPFAAAAFTLDGETVSKLIKMSKGSDVKLHMVLAAGLAVLLGKYTAGNDIIFGTPIYKQDVEIEFLNTVLVLRNRVDENTTFKELLLRVRQTVVGATEHQNYPLEILIEQLGMPYHRDGGDHRDRGDFPLFDVVLFHENIHNKHYLRRDYIDYNILFSFKRTGEHIDAAVEYNPELYEGATVTRIFNYYNRVLGGALSAVDTPVSQIDILSEEERKRILHDFNGLTAPPPEVRTLHRWFEARAAETPDRIALVSEELLRDIQLTYGELNKRSNQLARFLREKGAGPGSIVGLMVEKSLEMMVGILGILKAGSAYLPIDLTYPGGRIHYMLKDSNTRILLTYDGNTVPAAAKVAENPQLDTQLIDIFSPRIYRGDDSNPGGMDNPEDAAYIIYTSGSTGKPKGVVVEHRNAVAYIDAFYREFDIVSTDTALQQASYSFDVFVEEVYTLLFRGGKVALCPKYVLMDPAALSRFILKHRITFVSVSPLLLNEIDKLPDPGNIRIFISGGDVLKKEYITNLLKLKNRNVYNTYGPTETTVCATYHKCSVEDRPDLPIGKPIANYHVHILDGQERLQPIGVPGELCISGPGVARGYLNQPDLTNEKFCLRRPGGSFEKPPPGPPQNFLLSTPYPSLTSAGTPGPLTPLFYRTGDLARWLPDGGIQFLGRIDQQVKIRGFRIELGEIENFLLKHDAVDAALVRVKEMDNQQIETESRRYLCAYIAAKDELSIHELKEYLSLHLPGHMIPSFYVLLERMPVTAHGKPDLKALESHEPVSVTRAEYKAPETDIEIVIADTWKELLNLDDVGIHDNFFDLGGNSMLLLKTANKIGEVLGRNVPYVAMFQYTTIHTLAEYLNVPPGETEGDGPDRYAQQAETLDKGKDRMKKFIRKGKGGK